MLAHRLLHYLELRQDVLDLELAGLEPLHELLLLALVHNLAADQAHDAHEQVLRVHGRARASARSG